jgi:4-amino-4-deoxy-L-arabinose transferase-like glycosyltransferase
MNEQPRAVHQTLRVLSSTALPVLLAVAAIVLAFSGNSISFFQDESFAVWIANSGLRHIVEYLRYEPHPPLYHLILSFWIGLAGDSEQSVRTLSGVCYLLALAAIAWLGRPLLRRDELIVVLVIVACCPVLLVAAHFTRMYALVFLESCVALLAFSRLFLTQSGAAGMSILLATANLAGMLTHYYFAFVLLGQAIVFAVFVRRNWLAACFTLALPAVLFLAFWGPHLVSQLRTERFAGNMAQPLGWAQVGGEIWEYYRKRWILLLLWLAIPLFVAWPSTHGRWRTEPRSLKADLLAAGRDRRLQVFAIVWVTTFAGPFLAASLVGAQFWHGGPSNLPTLLPFAIILALISRSGAPRLKVILACVMLATTVGAEIRAHNLLILEDRDHRASIQRLKDLASDGDIIVGLDNYVTLFYYYMGRAPRAKQLEVRIYPPELGTHPGWYNEAATLKDRSAYVQETREYAAQRALELASRPGQKLWLIDTSWNPDTTRIVTGVFDATLRRVESIVVTGGSGYTNYIAYEAPLAGHPDR